MGLGFMLGCHEHERDGGWGMGDGYGDGCDVKGSATNVTLVTNPDHDA